MERHSCNDFLILKKPIKYRLLKIQNTICSCVATSNGTTSSNDTYVSSCISGENPYHWWYTYNFINNELPSRRLMIQFQHKIIKGKWYNFIALWVEYRLRYSYGFNFDFQFSYSYNVKSNRYMLIRNTIFCLLTQLLFWVMRTHSG